MRAALCTLALACLAATTARAIPRFDADDIYMEDYLQDLAERTKKSPVIEDASGGRSANDDRYSVPGGKTTAKDDPKDLKMVKGLRSSFDKLGTAVMTGKNDNSSSEPVREEPPSEDKADSSRSTRQNFPVFYNPEYREWRNFPEPRTFGSAGVTREPQAETVQEGEAGGGVGAGVGVGGGVGASGVVNPHAAIPHQQHPVHPLKQLKQLVPNIISAISAILPPPSPAAQVSAPQHLPQHPPPHPLPSPPPVHIVAPPPSLPPLHIPYPQKPGIIYSKQIILVPPGGYAPHRDIGAGFGFGPGPGLEYHRGPGLEYHPGPGLEYPDYASRFPLYPEQPVPVPAPTPVPLHFPVIPAAAPVPFDSRGFVFVVDAAGRGWYVPADGHYGPPTEMAEAPVIELSRGGEPPGSAGAGAQGGELLARAAPPTTVDQLRAEIEAELRRIARMEESFEPSLPPAGAGTQGAGGVVVDAGPVQTEKVADVVKGLDKVNITMPASPATTGGVTGKILV